LTEFAVAPVWHGAFGAGNNGEHCDARLEFYNRCFESVEEKGNKVSLDDFGTGYSSLNYLRQLPIDTLKIDKSFVQDIRANSKEEAIAKTVISLAHKLDLTVVAEGVETKEQLLFLKKEKCDKAQGYLFSKPLPAEEIEKMLRDKNVLSSARKLTTDFTVLIL